MPLLTTFETTSEIEEIKEFLVSGEIPGRFSSSRERKRWQRKVRRFETKENIEGLWLVGGGKVYSKEDKEEKFLALKEVHEFYAHAGIEKLLKAVPSHIYNVNRKEAQKVVSSCDGCRSGV
ncbi:MAG: uncharacterized protein A8A55_3248 [Amphiamblys sp. WSBS2006]|nr:MAG: uncharacterized protein A8A55_3248 [Amphiamblys sp. WSBS2006]